MATTTVKTLQREFPSLSREDASAIREKMRQAGAGESAEKALQFISGKLGGYGVEVIRGPHFHRGYWADAVLAYVNMGDTYKATIGFEPQYGFDGRFLVLPGGYGSWIEWYESKHGEVL